MWDSRVALTLCAVLVAADARAQGGISLCWDDCGAYGAANRSFACDTNADSSVMVGSYRIGAGPQITCFGGLNPVLSVQVAGGSLPSWWQFKNPGSCRQTSLRASAEFPYPAVNCGDPARGCGVGGIAEYAVGFGGPDRARIIAAVVVPCAWCIPVDGNIENYAFKLIIRHHRTVGTGGCDGCGAMARIVLNTIHVYGQSLEEQVSISDPLQRNYITWQGGTVDCPAATPTINRTWGALKSAYR